MAEPISSPQHMLVLAMLTVNDNSHIQGQREIIKIIHMELT